MAKEKSAPAPEEICTCAKTEGRCAPCLERLKPIADQFLKALLEFYAKVEWIGAANKPICRTCLRENGDDLGAMMVRDVLSKLDHQLQAETYSKLTLTLMSFGVTTLKKTQEAFEQLKPGPTSSLDALLRALYSGDMASRILGGGR